MTTKLGSVYTHYTTIRILKTTLIVTIFLLLAALATTCGQADTATADEGLVTSADVQPSETVAACPFYKGWNLTVLSGSPSDLPSCVRAVWYYEGRTERWYFWGRDNPTIFNDLTEFDITNGYWVWSQ